MLLLCSRGFEHPCPGVTHRSARRAHKPCTLCSSLRVLSRSPPHPTGSSGLALCVRDSAHLRKTEFCRNSSAFCWKYLTGNVLHSSDTRLVQTIENTAKAFCPEGLCFWMYVSQTQNGIALCAPSHSLLVFSLYIGSFQISKSTSTFVTGLVRRVDGL